MQYERAHRHGPPPRRNASHLTQITAMLGNLRSGDAPEPMRPRNNAQRPIGVSAVVKMNAYGNQLRQELSGRLAEPPTFLFRPRLAGSIGDSLGDGNTEILMQSD